ncbi:MAG TPA: helix-turn-helix transcriptional regulator [Solirubrobacterales bacterium]|nr:helix-turn-helix transcriptional regulator [Solirubrobacterales bacterium]
MSNYKGPEDDAARLAHKLREAREYVNLSQQFVAAQTGIPRSAISDMERGTRRVESLELKRLAELYRMPIEFFLGTDPDPEAAGAVEDPTLAALTRAAEGLEESSKDEVLRFALFLQNFDRPSEAEK